MNVTFDEVHNYWEQQVFAEIMRRSDSYPEFDTDLLADTACVALNLLPSRYVRFDIDLVFFMSQHERQDGERALQNAVDFAFSFVAERTSKGASPRQKV